jgi:hypothetical protein
MRLGVIFAGELAGRRGLHSYWTPGNQRVDAKVRGVSPHRQLIYFGAQAASARSTTAAERSWRRTDKPVESMMWKNNW